MPTSFKIPKFDQIYDTEPGQDRQINVDDHDIVFNLDSGYVKIKKDDKMHHGDDIRSYFGNDLDAYFFWNAAYDELELQIPSSAYRGFFAGIGGDDLADGWDMWWGYDPNGFQIQMVSTNSDGTNDFILKKNVAGPVGGSGDIYKAAIMNGKGWLTAGGAAKTFGFEFVNYLDEGAGTTFTGDLIQLSLPSGKAGNNSDKYTLIKAQNYNGSSNNGDLAGITVPAGNDPENKIGGFSFSNYNGASENLDLAQLYVYNGQGLLTTQEGRIQQVSASSGSVYSSIQAWDSALVNFSEVSLFYPNSPTNNPWNWFINLQENVYTNKYLKLVPIGSPYTDAEWQSNADINLINSVIEVNGTQVVGGQLSAITDIVDTSGTDSDGTARAAINTILARLRSHGLIAT